MPAEFSTHVAGLMEFLKSEIRRGDLVEEINYTQGYHATIAELLSKLEFTESQADLHCSQIRDEFAERLREESGKVSEAEVTRRIVRLDTWSEKTSEKQQCTADVIRFEGFKKNLEMRHMAVVALINRENAEIRAQHA